VIDGSRIPRSQWVTALESLVRAGMRDHDTPPLSATSVRYKRESPGRERWQTPRDTYLSGEGDCEDLSIYFARDLRLRGIPARVVIKRTHSGGLHAIVAAHVHGRVVLLDPSKARGM